MSWLWWAEARIEAGRPLVLDSVSSPLHEAVQPHAVQFAPILLFSDHASNLRGTPENRPMRDGFKTGQRN
jgi:hypothetical protein